MIRVGQQSARGASSDRIAVSTEAEAKGSLWPTTLAVIAFSLVFGCVILVKLHQEWTAARAEAEASQARTAAFGPIRVGVIGAGKFSSMFLTQANKAANIHVVGVADINVPKAKAALARTGWAPERYSAATLDEAVRTGGTAVIDSADTLITHPAVEVILEITGNPLYGTYHAVTAIDKPFHRRFPPRIMVRRNAGHRSETITQHHCASVSSR